MILSDFTIREEYEQGRLLIEPFDDKLVQPAGYDIRLGKEFLVYLSGATNPIVEPMTMNADNAVHYERIVCNKDRPYFHLYPNGFVLGTTLEKFSIPNDMVGFIDGKSSLGRIGLMINISSRNIAPGFEGALTIEMLNVTNRPIKLIPGMPIAQMYFIRTDRPVEFPYGTEGLGHHYNGQDSVSPSDFRRLK